MMRRYWLLSGAPHATELQNWYLGRVSEFIIYREGNEIIDTYLVNRDDVVYMFQPGTGIYAWGYLLESGNPIKILRGAIKVNLIDISLLDKYQEFPPSLLSPKEKFTFLTRTQVKILNSLIVIGFTPPLPNVQFIIGEAVDENEDLHTEFKDINVKEIANVAYDYAVAFLNQEGGRIYFGVNDGSKTVNGVNLFYSDLDKLGLKIEDKLKTILPALIPDRDYSLGFHKVLNKDGSELSDRYVVEVEIKPSAAQNFQTAGGKSFIKTYTGKMRIE